MAARRVVGEEARLVGLHHLADHPRIGERKVGPEYDALGTSDLIERAEGLLAWRQRIVVPEMPEAGEHLFARQLRQALVDHRRHRQPPREIGHQSAGMGQDESDARIAHDRPREDQVHRRARGIEQILHHECRPGQRQPLARGMQAGMNEHHRAARIEQLEQGVEMRVTEKFLAVACEQRDPVATKLIEGIADLVDRALHRPHRHGCQDTEAPRASARSGRLHSRCSDAPAPPRSLAYQTRRRAAPGR